MTKTVITCAVTGAETTREQNPNLPITPAEIADAAAEAHEAGAAILHLHVRDAEGNPSQDVTIFRNTIELIRSKCDIVIEATTGGAVGMSLEERMQPLELNVEMASLDCGTVNFDNDYIVNTLPMIRQCATPMKERGVRPTLECFDLSHIDAADILISEGIIDRPLHYGIVLNVPGGVRYDKKTLTFFTERLPAGSSWTTIAIGGRVALNAIRDTIELDGFVRVGMEDNIWYGKGELAKSNAQLVAQAAQLITASGRELATPSDVRKMFKLKGFA